MAKRIICIGGGIAGLSSGVHARRSGYDAVVLEKNAYLGGYCTTYNKKDYKFEGMMHCLYGTKPGSHYYNIWKDLGITDSTQFVKFDSFRGFTLQDGTTLNFWQDFEKFRAELVNLCDTEHDKQGAKLFMEDIYNYNKASLGYSFLSFYHQTPDDFPLDYFDKILNNKKLVKLFTNCLGNNSTMKSKMLMFTSLINGNCAFPVGGSNGFANKIAKTFTDMGGKIYNNAEVDQILIEGDKATGVRLKGGEILKADQVIVNSDLKRGYDLIPRDKFRNDRVEQCMREADLYPSVVQVNLGLSCPNPLKETYSMFKGYEIKNPLSISGVKCDSLLVRTLNGPEFCPPGHSVMQLFDYCLPKYWMDLSKEDYLKEKDRVSNLLINEAYNIFPEIKNKVDCIHVNTPVTLSTLTNNTGGIFLSFMYTKKNATFVDVMSNPFKGINNLHLASQWKGMYAGLHCSAEHGKVVIEKINQIYGKS